ncbi:MAG: ABC transporter permease subunit [Kofleriaceae bacterium]
MPTPPGKGSGSTPDRVQGPDGPDGHTREPVVPEPTGGDPLPDTKAGGAGATAGANAPAAAPAKVRDLAAEAAALAALEAELGGAPPPASAKVPDELAPAKATPAAMAEAEAKPAPKPDAKPGAKSEAKPAPEAKSAPKPEAKPAPKPDAKKPEPEPDPADDPDKLPTAPPWWKTLRADPPPLTRAALGAGLVGLLLLLWFVLTFGSDPTARIVSPSKLPSPGEVFGSFGKLLDRDFTDSLVDTLIRVFKGIGLAALIGISAGVWAGANRGVGSALEPLVIFLRSVPMGALIPLTLLLFGDGEKQKWMFIFLAVVPFVFSDTVKAVSIVPERYVETAQTLGASRFQIVRKVLIPLALPDIITSLRFLLGLALGYIMLVEVVNTPHGLGTMLNTSQRQGLYEQIYLLLFVITFVAFTLDFLLRGLQREAFRWRKDL